MRAKGFFYLFIYAFFQYNKLHDFSQKNRKFNQIYSKRTISQIFVHVPKGNLFQVGKSN